MTMLINLATKQELTDSEFRAAFPNTSFGPVIDYASFGYAVVYPTPQPAHDPVIQTVRRLPAVLTNKGHYEQAWEVVPRFSDYTDEDGVLHTRAEQEAAAIEADRKARVPQVVTTRQAKLALLQAGLLDDIETAIAQADRATQIEWEYATEFKRTWPTLLAMQTTLGLTDQQLDDLFTLAATL